MHLSPNYSRITKQTFSIVDEPLYESMSDSDDKDSSRSDVISLRAMSVIGSLLHPARVEDDPVRPVMPIVASMMTI